MYFLTDLEQKILINKILPQARRKPPTEELRGWMWHTSPLAPYYDDVKLPMFLVSSKYCPTSRDVFLNRVIGEKGKINFNVSAGMTLHETVAAAYTLFKEGKNTSYDIWWEKNKKYINYVGINDEGLNEIRKMSESVWNYCIHQCRAKFDEAHAHQPYARKTDIMATALPFLIEHRISGEALGLSGLLGVDCYDYLHGIVYDLKTVKDVNKVEEWYKMAPTGYALVIESVYEIPVDIGSVVYVAFKNDRLVVRKDIFFINDELRSWWLEERDKKLEIVAEKKDPGMPKECYHQCIYASACGVDVYEKSRG